MNREKIWIISVIIAVSATVICSASIFFSYRAHVSSKKLVREYRTNLSAIRQSYVELKKQFSIITNEQYILQSKLTEKNIYPSPVKPHVSASTSKDKPAIDQEKKVQQLSNIISSTGLDQLAADVDFDPTFLSKIHEDYVSKELRANYREQILTKNHELHQLDRDQYDEDLMALYDRARLRRRGMANTEDQKEAFTEMLSDYPDAYATGMAIAERALRSAIIRETNGVQDYYSLLVENDNFSDIVTDRGVEAMPNLQNYLAYNYIQEGRIEEAQDLIDSLENNYSNSYIYTRGADRRFQLVPVSQAAENLRWLIK